MSCIPKMTIPTFISSSSFSSHLPLEAGSVDSPSSVDSSRCKTHGTAFFDLVDQEACSCVAEGSRATWRSRTSTFVGFVGPGKRNPFGFGAKT